MSWERFPPSRPRKVDGGLKARSARGAIAQTWWSKRFIAVLESLGMGARLTRGRTYARAGQVLSLDIRSGAVVARVQGSRRSPYDVTIGLPTFAAREWADVERVLAEQALFRAKLLAGEMPQEIEDAFAECDLSLFPRRDFELAMACSCPDWAVPCKHIAAVFYLLAEHFDADPFLVLAWRGRRKDVLLASLRDLAGSETGGPDEASAAPRLAPDPPLADQIDRFWVAGPWELPVTPSPITPDVVLREVELPAIEVRGRPLAEFLRPAYEALHDS